MRKKVIMVSLALVTLLSGCGGLNTSQNTNVADSKQTFAVDSMTRHASDVVETEDEIVDNTIMDSSTNNTNIIDNNFGQRTPLDYIGVLTLTGSDTTTKWETDGTDVTYNGKVFHGLYSNVASMQTPYDINTFINFIVKTYNATGNEFYTDVFTGQTSGEVAEGEDDTMMDVDEELSVSEKYINLRDTQGEAQWEFSVYTYGGDNKITVYGNGNYMLIANTTSDVEIDMSQYNYSFGDNGIQQTDGEEPVVNEENTDTEEVNTEEIQEDIENE